MRGGRATPRSRVRFSFHGLSASLPILTVAHLPWLSEEECSTLPKQNQKPTAARQEPGPGRSTSEQAFNDVRKEIAQRNEQAHQEARKLRAAREQERLKWCRTRGF
jgi:pyruvate/2-oxoglutarate dehydrogenase complex dihydrolipoamide acyltransferase (E2) component